MKLISQPRVGRAYNEIISLHYAARELEWEVLPAPSGWRLDSSVTGKGVPYGSQIFCEVIAQQMNWTLKLNPFDWLAKLPHKYILRQIDFMPLKDSVKTASRKFIKPADDKCFDAKIYEPGELVRPEILSEDTPTLVSDVVSFIGEYRCLVRANKVVSCSCYVYNEEVAEPENWFKFDLTSHHPVDFVNEMLEEVSSENAVIDVGVLAGTGQLAIIESNPVWASGLYGCDPIEALLTMKGAVDDFVCS